MTTALQPSPRFEWERILRRVVIPGPTKLVAAMLAQYADPRGGNARPGVSRLASVCGMGASTVRRHLDVLRDLGLVECLSGGGGPRKAAAVYRLTIPEDLLERVKLLGPDETTALAVVSAVPEPADEVTPLAQESAVGVVHTPVDTEISAHPGERSSDENCAHSEGELRSPGPRTALTQVSAHQPNSPTKPHHPRSPKPGTSPAIAVVDDDDYRAARTKLAALPDLGTSLIAAAPPELQELRERILWAAAHTDTVAEEAS